jgi:hypothetical protein
MKQFVHQTRLLLLLYVGAMVTVSLTVAATHLGLANAQQQNNETGGPQSMASNTTNANIVLVHGTFTLDLTLM